MIELQALASPTGYGQPRRTANGIDINRLHLLIAVLTRRCGLPLTGQDIFVNVVGGLKIGEPASDLSVALSIASSYKDLKPDPEMVVLGEVGLGGELRTVSHIERRLHEAAKLGFTSALIPSSVRRDRLKTPDDMRIVSAPDLETAIAMTLGSDD